MEIDKSELEIMRTVCERASDFKLGRQNDEFAQLNGGLGHLEDRLMVAVISWESVLDGEDG